MYGQLIYIFASAKEGSFVRDWEDVEDVEVDVGV